MDGVPVFNFVRETMPGVSTIVGFRGVVNSTTNHILTALEDGEDFAPALARMQAAGIAEADPSLDVDGWDAAAKTAALANVFLDARITPHDVDRSGIGPDDAERGARAPRRAAARAAARRRRARAASGRACALDRAAARRRPRRSSRHGQRARSSRPIMLGDVAHLLSWTAA